MAKLSPLQYFGTDANGNPYSGAQVFTYAAGSSTKQAAYKDNGSAVAHANPIVLNSRGMADDPIWLTEGETYKFVLAPSGDTDPPASAIETWDNIEGINDTSTTQDQWVSGPAPTYVSATSFTLAGDQSSTFHVGRRLKTTNTGGTIYSTITAVAYTSLTTVTVINDSGSLDAGLSAVSYALLSAENPSVPLVNTSKPAFLAILATDMTNATGNNTTAKVTFESEVFDRGSNYDNSTNYNFTAPITGVYHFDVQVTLYNVGTSADTIDLALVTSNRTFNFEIDATNAIAFTASGDIVHNLSVLTDMDINDTAHVNVTVNGVGADSVEVRGSNNKTFFSGYLVA